MFTIMFCEKYNDKNINECMCLLFGYIICDEMLLVGTCHKLILWLVRSEAVIDITTTKIRTSTSELCTRGIDTCTLVTMVGQILTTVCWHCGMACLAIG